MKRMTEETSNARGVHTCSYACERPECIRAQRDELASRMTAETSNARGDSRPGIDRLWDSQWVNIVNSPEVLEALGFRDCEEAVNIAVRMTEQAMAKNFAAARGDVRGLVAKWRAEAASMESLHRKQTGYEVDWSFRAKEEALDYCADELESALAAEGVQAGEVEKRARELLAQHCECGGGMQYTKTSDALRAIASALSQQPEARGVVDAPSVDDLSRDAMAALLRSEKVYAKWSDLAADALAVAQSMHAALTEARNG